MSSSSNLPFYMATITVLCMFFLYSKYDTERKENVELSITLQKTEHKLVEKTNEVKMLEEQIAELKGE